MPGTTRVLMVGTIEPRKAHGQALDALEVLWGRGASFELVVAGRQGWMVESLVERLRTHEEIGRRLHLVDGPDDRMLKSLYEQCDILLMASRGEGFGLPIVEAGRLGLGLVVRDLPVFHEAAGDSATYFVGDTGAVLADALLAHPEGPAGPRDGGQWTTWAQCASAITHLVMPADGGTTVCDPCTEQEFK